MSKHYDWRLSSEIISGGYDGEETGVIPPDTGNGFINVIFFRLLIIWYRISVWSSILIVIFTNFCNINF